MGRHITPNPFLPIEPATEGYFLASSVLGLFLSTLVLLLFVFFLYKEDTCLTLRKSDIYGNECCSLDDRWIENIDWTKTLSLLTCIFFWLAEVFTLCALSVHADGHYAVAFEFYTLIGTCLNLSMMLTGFVLVRRLSVFDGTVYEVEFKKKRCYYIAVTFYGSCLIFLGLHWQLMIKREYMEDSRPTKRQQTLLLTFVILTPLVYSMTLFDLGRRFAFNLADMVAQQRIHSSARSQLDTSMPMQRIPTTAPDSPSIGPIPSTNLSNQPSSFNPSADAINISNTKDTKSTDNNDSSNVLNVAGLSAVDIEDDDRQYKHRSSVDDINFAGNNTLQTSRDVASASEVVASATATNDDNNNDTNKVTNPGSPRGVCYLARSVTLSNFDSNQVELIQVAAKHMTLVLVEIGSMLLAAAGLVCYIIAFDRSQVWWSIGFSLLHQCCTVVPLCLFASFGFGHWLYKHCCATCDRAIARRTAGFTTCLEMHHSHLESQQSRNG